MATALSPLRTREKDWLATVREAAQRLGWMDYHVHDSRRSPSGFPDLILVRPPRLVVAELKTERGRVAAAQQRWLWTFAQVPWLEVEIWRPGDWDRVLEVLG